MSTTLESRIKELSAQIGKHNVAYYRDDAPTITDGVYDDLYRELSELEAAHPGLVKKDSPTQKLDIKLSDGKLGLKEVRHETPMMSIDSKFDPKDAVKFNADMEAVSGGEVEYSAEKKFDGMALNLRYVNGKLILAATRGDHEIGEDVTANAMHIESIPKAIPYDGKVEIRGEVMISTAMFITLNGQRESAGEKLFANSRNAAAGSLRMKDPAETGRRGLMFQAYSITDATLPDGLTRQSDVLDWLRISGFAGVDEPEVVIGFTGIQSHFEKVSENRHLLPYDIDGVVYKVNDLGVQLAAGMRSRTPRGMMAYKFNQQEAMTVVKAIDIQIGRTGALTPVARLSPIGLGGVIVQNATLHNIEEIRRKDIRVGDTVTVCRKGDVIPGVVRVEVGKRPAGGLPEFQMPTTCPCCDAPVVREETSTGEDKATTSCSGGQSCPEQLYQQLVYFVSRVAMNIDGVGESLCRQLFDKALVKTPADLYDLTVAQVMAMPGMAKKSATNVISAIDASRRPELRKFLVSLGIRNAAEGTAKRLAKVFGNIDAIKSASLTDMMSVEDVGPVVANSLYRYFNDPDTRRSLDVILSKLSVQEEARIVATNNPITGKTFVITGTLPDGMKREEAKAWIEGLGAKTSGSVSKNTDYLLCGEDAGTKLDKAKELGVAVLSLSELRSLVSPADDDQQSAGFAP